MAWELPESGVWDQDLAGCWLASKYVTRCGPSSSLGGEHHIIFTDQRSLSIERKLGNCASMTIKTVIVPCLYFMCVTQSC